MLYECIIIPSLSLSALLSILFKKLDCIKIGRETIIRYTIESKLHLQDERKFLYSRKFRRVSLLEVLDCKSP